ncbi:hypothetical protein TrLO_g9089 [Triparma laevis f. longispina]|uniref:Uncharacterized protein n=1 Tax=Triparma laevis f. longispina TaxID=1714387 RepID=A0A9W7AIP9_9STRA|nr:hypothetical protein TrLO_g9089 [Triparma laevis f. longispina]
MSYEQQALSVDNIPLSPKKKPSNTPFCTFKKTVYIIVVIGACVGGSLAFLFKMGLLGFNCGWDLSFSDKTSVCVEVPPKTVVDSSRRTTTNYLRRVLSMLHEPTAEEQSMSFSCADGLTTEQADACAQYCNADYIFIKQVFLVEDEFESRESWSGGHVQVVVMEETKSFNFDYALGCSDEDEYLTQIFTDSSFQCGYSEIGYDLYHRVPTSPCAISGNCETNTINRKTYYYASMSNLVFGGDLQSAINDVKTGVKKPGVYTYAYPKSYDHIVQGCSASYKVDFSIPQDYYNATVVG